MNYTNSIYVGPTNGYNIHNVVQECKSQSHYSGQSRPKSIVAIATVAMPLVPSLIPVVLKSLMKRTYIYVNVEVGN